jgi:hypothetical protein
VFSGANGWLLLPPLVSARAQLARFSPRFAQKIAQFRRVFLEKAANCTKRLYGARAAQQPRTRTRGEAIGVVRPRPLSEAVSSTAQHSTAQHSTAQHSTAQHSTAQHSTAQHSTHTAQRHRGMSRIAGAFAAAALAVAARRTALERHQVKLKLRGRTAWHLLIHNTYDDVEEEREMH